MAAGLGELGILFAIIGYFISKYFGFYWAIAIFVGFVLSQIFRLQQKLLVWKRLGVAGPEPTILLGNIVEFTSEGMHSADTKWSKMYGKIYGTYFFTQPDLVISDVDLLKKILVKDFQNFINRRETGSFADRDSVFAKLLVLMKDDEWKNVRSRVTPAFTSGKMKHMIGQLDDSVKTLVDIFAKNSTRSENFDVKKNYAACMMDIIASTAFGIKTDCQQNSNNPFLIYANEINSFNFVSFGFMFKVVFFPWIAQQLHKRFGVKFMFKKPEEFYGESLKRILESRKSNPLIDKPDFLQIMLNAAESKDVEDVNDDAISHDLGKQHQRLPLTNKQIMSQSFLFLVAGYDTTATALTWMTYLLAVHPEVQDACYQEIVSKIGNEPVTYTHVQHELPYLDAVMSETLRLYPPAVRTDRTCLNDYQLTDNFTIPKNSTISVPIYVIHHDEQHYPEPEKFLPERFMHENKANRNPLTYLPFGYGPRNCIGMRFAQTAMKFVMANLIRKYEFYPSDKTEAYPPKLGKANILSPANPITLKVKTRV